MIDFLLISERELRNYTEIKPKFIIKKSNDLMIRGGDFYAIWVEERGLWSTDEQDVVTLIDRELDRYVAENKDRFNAYRVFYMRDSESRMIDSWHHYCQKQLRDNFHPLDDVLIFANSDVKKEDYASKKLPYALEKGDAPSYEKIISTLYREDERRKLEWAIGSVVNGDSKKIQKFLVLYGSAGTGKSTILNIIQMLFDGYYAVFDAKALGSSSDAFALEAFKTNPLVAIQHDGDLSRIEDNTRLNSLVSHEMMTVNEKHKSIYSNRFKSFLFMGSNKPVKITDSRSGITRRLIDVRPSGNRLPLAEYERLYAKVKFELGAIAWHCKEVYEEDPDYYSQYVPSNMLDATNDFYNFVSESYLIFKKEKNISLERAWAKYKTYAEEAKISYPYPKRSFKEELKSYFKSYDDKEKMFYDFIEDRFESKIGGRKEGETESKEVSYGHWITLKEMPSLFDNVAKDYKAQYATNEGKPMKAWDKVNKTLSELDTAQLHYVLFPDIHHIVIDFDLKDENGEKSLTKNIGAAELFPKTYAEVSKSGKGLHLHYIYSGNPEELSRIYDEGIEVKIFTGNSSLRRKLTLCNDIPIATIGSGLPLKGELKKLVDNNQIRSERGLRSMIKRNLCKEFHPGTKPSIDFIYEILEGVYKNGLSYDVTDLKPAIISFAAGSTNQADYCLKLAMKMHYKSDDAIESVDKLDSKEDKNDESDLVFFDTEIFPNLFIVCYKKAGKDNPIIRLINPVPDDISTLMKMKLVGFNCRRYDNHILYARYMGYEIGQLYELSQRIINADKKNQNKLLFGAAYNISYTDVYDFAAKKQSLKKWEIELGIHHQELGLPWDEPVPEHMWGIVADYCCNDVIATEATFDHLKADFLARKILADLAGGSLNDTTNTLTQKIVFGNDRHPELVYTNLATGDSSDGTHKDTNAFPEYEWIFSEEDQKFHNMYRGTDVGKGGYVYAETGIWTMVAVLDSQSHHPTSTIELNAFGEHTKNFKDILDARIYIKHKDYDSARKMLNGKLAPYLDDPSTAKQLAQALKIAINAVYGQTSAGYDNPFRDSRNVNNIVALRGALFMRLLQDEVNARGFKTIHFKTDSVKIPNATPEIIRFVQDFGKKYGYTMEHESTYEKMCLVNDAVYIAKYATKEKCQSLYGYIPEKNGEHSGEWTPTGDQFAVSYVFKTLFSKEALAFDDFCETFSVTKGALYLDMNEALPDVSEAEAALSKLESKFKKGQLSDTTFETEGQKLSAEIEKGHDLHFIGRVGQFCPIKAGCGGGVLYRVDNGKRYAASGTTGYRWMESEMVRQLSRKEDIDISYYRKLVDDAVETISKYGDFEWFVSDDPYTTEIQPDFINVPENVTEEGIPF